MWSMDELLVLQIFVTQSLSMVQLKKLLPFYTSDFHGNTEPDDPCQNSSTSSDKWCYCGGPEEGQMICCDNKKCPIVWQIV